MELNAIIKFFEYYPYAQNNSKGRYTHQLIEGLEQLFGMSNIDKIIHNKEYNQFVLSLKAYAKKEEIEEFFYKINLLLDSDDGVNKLWSDINMILLSWCRLRDKHYPLNEEESLFWMKFFTGDEVIVKDYPEPFIMSAIQWKRWRHKIVYKINDNYEHIAKYDYYMWGSINEQKKKIINGELERLISIDEEGSRITKVDDIPIRWIHPETLIFISMMGTIMMLILVIFIL